MALSFLLGQMRISVPNSTGYHRQSTGETEQLGAIRKALNKYEGLAIKGLSGGSLNSQNLQERLRALESWFASYGG